MKDRQVKEGRVQNVRFNFYRSRTDEQDGSSRPCSKLGALPFFEILRSKNARLSAPVRIYVYALSGVVKQFTPLCKRDSIPTQNGRESCKCGDLVCAPNIRDSRWNNAEEKGIYQLIIRTKVDCVAAVDSPVRGRQWHRCVELLFGLQNLGYPTTWIKYCVILG